MALAGNFGSRLKDAMRLAGADLAEVAQAAGRARNAVSSWRSGKKRPPWSVVKRMCEKLGWPLEVFREGGPEPAERASRLASAHGVREPSTEAPYISEEPLESALARIAGELLGLISRVRTAAPAESAVRAARIRDTAEERGSGSDPERRADGSG